MVKVKKFRPFKQPRYLPGSVPKGVYLRDLKSYNNHRYKVFTAQPKVDTKPPPMNPYDYVDKRKIMQHATRLKRIDHENKELLKQISKINRTGTAQADSENVPGMFLKNTQTTPEQCHKGKVDTYNPRAYMDMSNWRIHMERMKRIGIENKKIYKQIGAVYSEYRRSIMDEFWNYMLEQFKTFARFPLVALEKIPLECYLQKQPSISSGLPKLGQRPQCFMDFKVSGGAFLGRIIVELYHDYVPVTVQNFLEICKGGSDLTYKGCPVHRIVPGQFFETGDITKGTGRGGFSIYGDTFDEENHVLRHTKAGVLSMRRIGTTQRNNSQFCISLGKMEQLDRKNVVFGKIIKGADTITKIQGYGRRVGKPLTSVIISNCGEYKEKEKEKRFSAISQNV